MDKWETNSDYEIKKKIICKNPLFKECFKKIIIPWDCFCLVYMSSVQTLK